MRSTNDGNLSLDVFAYDLNEPDVVTRLVKLGRTKRVRVILDNAALHHNADGDKPEDEFEAMFAKAAGKKNIKRGKFGRYAHDKVFIVSDGSGAKKVLTGSTNFSVTGLYVNSNHVLIFDDAKVAGVYASVFNEAWDDEGEDGGIRGLGMGNAELLVRQRIRAEDLDHLLTAQRGIRRRDPRWPGRSGSPRRARKPPRQAACCSR